MSVTRQNILDALFAANGPANEKTFGGIPIYENPLLPEFNQKIKLSYDAPVTDEFRLNFNHYLLDMFGGERYMIIMDSLYTGKSIVMHPNTKKWLMHKLKEEVNFLPSVCCTG